MRQRAVKTAKLIAAVATTQAPYLVLADDDGTDPDADTSLRGVIGPGDGLSKDEWKTFAGGADAIAKAVFDETGLRTVFHHHCAGYVETPDEIATLLEMTDPERLGMVFDAGHYVHGTGSEECDLVAALDRFKDRIWYIHLKDLEPNVARRSREEEWDYFTAMRQGLYPELGKGVVDFPALLRWLAARDYKGYVLVEQDMLPGMGTPKESARRNREYIRSIEANLHERRTMSDGVRSESERGAMKKLHFGIIGAGRIGKVHAETLAFRLPEAEIVAIADMDRVAAQQLAARCGIPKVVETAQRFSGIRKLRRC